MSCKFVTVELSTLQPLLAKLEEQGAITVNLKSVVPHTVQLQLDTQQSILSQLEDQQIITVNLRTPDVITVLLQEVPALEITLECTIDGINNAFTYTFPFNLA